MVTMTFVTIPLMDRLGRRTLHLGGLAGIVLFCVLITVAQNLDPASNDGVAVFLIVSTLGFVVFFALGPGSIPWLITGELFRQGPRPAATAIGVAVNWTANLVRTVVLLLSLAFQSVHFFSIRYSTFTNVSYKRNFNLSFARLSA